MNNLENEVKALIIEALNLEDMTPEDIETDAPLFGEGLGLDSIDALELGLAVKKRFGVSLSGETEEVRAHFRSVASLAAFIRENRTEEKYEMEKTYTKEELFDEIVRVMGDLFEVDTEGVTRESRLVEDLDLDSIDAVDMIVHLQNMIGKRIKPEAFKSVRTVGDVVDVIYDFSQQNGEAAN